MKRTGFVWPRGLISSWTHAGRQFAFTLLVLPLPAQTPAFKSWVKSLESRGVQVSAGCWKLEPGKARLSAPALDRHRDDQLLVPASTTKAVSTYALLKTWKPDHTLVTEVWGQLEGGVVKGDLTFKGGGDPFLVSERIYSLAWELQKLGVKRVLGGVRLDQGAFDGQRFEEGWGGTSSDTTPPILPLSVNFNRDEGRIVQDPERLARETLLQVLGQAGIAFEGRMGLKDAPARLLEWKSPPLRMLAGDINKFSNNFMIEMLVKAFGEGSWAKGTARIHEFYAKEFGLGPGQLHLTDGSGLSKRNRLTARTLATILRAAWYDFEVGPEYVASLKVIGGEPWKLKMKDPNLARRLRVKTGHLDKVETICGYILMPDGTWRVFAILLNGPCREDDLWEQVSRWAN